MAGLLDQAQAGPALAAELIPLDGRGKLRVTYNWLYSALNCDPNDNSSFVWNITKLDDTHVSLSPRDQYNGMTLYASVRPDWSFYVQVQAPFSADWIRAVGGDEVLGMSSQGMLVAGFTGLNGSALAVDPATSNHDGHDAYRVRSVGSADPQSRLWFLGVQQVLQPRLEMAYAAELNATEISAALDTAGVAASEKTVTTIQAALRPVEGEAR
jgi:hypothetical protein